MDPASASARGMRANGYRKSRKKSLAKDSVRHNERIIAQAQAADARMKEAADARKKEADERRTRGVRAPDRDRDPITTSNCQMYFAKVDEKEEILKFMEHWFTVPHAKCALVGH